MYNPPIEKDWYWTDDTLKWFREVYDAGYNAGKGAKNPYKPSGHERDTTTDDELHYWWDRGNRDFLDN